MFLQAIKTLSTVAMPHSCGVLRLVTHPCQLQNFVLQRSTQMCGVETLLLATMVTNQGPFLLRNVTNRP